MFNFFNKKTKVYRVYFDDEQYESVVAKNFKEARKKIIEKYPDVEIVNEKNKNK